jgi:peptidoglycan/LPS O-acetylase OafA/YrhL
VLLDRARLVFQIVKLTMVNSSAPVQTRFITLDALRGVAALMVVFYHAGRMFNAWPPRFGYLAVDLFFILSGFVLAFSYDRRLEAGMTLAEFLRRRAIRLYPLYLLGLILGISVATLSPFLAAVTFKNMIVSVGFNLLMIPAPKLAGFQVETEGVLFPLDVSFWSLLFEFWVANVVFALFFKQLHGKLLLTLIGICAAALLVTEREFHTLSVGADWVDYLAGFPRVGFSFFAGVLLARNRIAWSQNLIVLPSWLLVAIVPLLLSLPLEGKPAHLFELFCVLIIFPAILAFGARSDERSPGLGAALGDASYAIYTVHAPLLTFVSWAIGLGTRIRLGLTTEFVFAAALIPVGALLHSADEALRKRLMARFGKDGVKPACKTPSSPTPPPTAGS